MKVTSTDIKNSFGKYLRLCSTEPVYITKNGKTIAKLLNHSQEDEEGEGSFPLGLLYGVNDTYVKAYPPGHMSDAAEAYNLQPVTMTFEEFTKMNEEANNRYEYIDGQVYMLAAPTVFHQRVIARMHIVFNNFLEGKTCDVFMSPFDVTLHRRNHQKSNVVQPDLLIVCNWRDEVDESGHYLGIPRLVVEVLSPSSSRKDMITKLDLYKDSGIEEYWIVDQEMSQILIYHFENYEIAGARIYKEGETCRSFIYEGLEFCVKE